MIYALPGIRLDLIGRTLTLGLDYVTRRFNPESIRGWDTALRDLQNLTGAPSQMQDGVKSI